MLTLGRTIPALFCTLCLLAAADSVHAQEKALPVAEAVKAYAARLGAQPGTPQYAAALRDGLMKAADQLKTDQGYNTTRSVTLTPAATRSPMQVLAIDSDPDYQAWLEQAALLPVIDLTIARAGRMAVRSVGGEKLTNPALFPEVGMALQLPSSGYCSGVLMNRRTLLSAAHCLCSYKQGHLVVFGLGIPSKQRYPMKIAKVRQREPIDCADGWQSVRGRDIAVIRLSEDVPVAAVSATASIADADAIHREFARQNRLLWTVGFGYMDTKATGEKNVALVPILSPDCSRAGDESKYGCVRGREILAKDPRRVGPCPGDSGGGGYLMVEETVEGKTRRKPQLVGLVSRSTLNSTVPCGDGAIFTLLTKDAVDWAKRAADELAR